MEKVIKKIWFKLIVVNQYKNKFTAHYIHLLKVYIRTSGECDILLD